MTSTVADYLLQRLRDWGVEYVFGYAGDGINGLLVAWQQAADQPRFIQARHEEMAAFEACGYAKFSGRVGICAATSGPGAIHLLNGLYDAKLDHVGVVAIVGQTARSAMGGSYQQEVDLLSLFKDVANEYCQMITVPEQLPNVIDRAIRIAGSRRTVTAVIIPSDVQELDYSPPTHAFKMVPSSLDHTWAAPIPSDADVRRAADVLNAGEKAAMLVGQGARQAVKEVTTVADLLGAGVAKALLGKDVLSDELDWVTGSIVLLGTRPSYELMMDCDTLLVVGSNFPYTQFLPGFDADGPKARAVQIDVDPTMVGLRYPFEVNLVGDAAATLHRLMPLLHRKNNRSWRETVENNVQRWWEVMDRRAGVSADPINPEQVFAELSPRLPENAMLSADSGSGTNWYARHVKIRGTMRGTLSGTLATMGCGVPYAIGAKFAHPDRPAYALVGDGAMQMNNMAELITVAKYRHRWQNGTFVVCVFNNEDLNQVTWEQRVMNGDPRFDASQNLPNVPYHKFAQLIGLKGIYVDNPDRMGAAWDEALASDVPVVLEVKTDPEVPPLPPHITFDQAKKFTSMLFKDDPEEKHLLKDTARQVLASILPGKE
jgi:pyruvate dehydrogenase (quinone)